MTPGEAGFLLLTSTLGNPARKVLTDAQLRTLAKRVAQRNTDAKDEELSVQHLVELGYRRSEGERIVALLSQQEELRWYLSRAKQKAVYPITRISSAYPQILRKRLGSDCPGCLWAKGDVTFLNTPMIGLVGSRDLRDKNKAFARAVGRQAAEQGYTLVSGNARGADKEAQEACLEAGGRVICVIADSLEEQPLHKNILYLSESGFDLPFSSYRALHRNRIVHALPEKVFVAQCAMGGGGTWSGTTYNLQRVLTPVYVYQDESRAAAALKHLGAQYVELKDLQKLDELTELQSVIW